MELVISLSAPTQPLDAGISAIVAAEAKRVFRSVTAGGQQAVTVTDVADTSTAALTISDVVGVDAGTQTMTVTWTDSADAAVIGYLVRVYDAGIFDVQKFAAVGAQTCTLTPVGAAGTYTVDLHAIIAAPVVGSDASVVVA